MTIATAVARHYGLLTPEERFWLILAAGARGDAAEHARLLAAGQRVLLRVQDHAAFAHAFAEVSVLLFTELLDNAAEYVEAFLRADSAVLEDPNTATERTDDDAEGTNEDDAGEPEAGSGGEAAAACPGRSIADRYMAVALAAGFTLKTKADGWKLFCARLGVPPLAAWAGLPGLPRLERALALAEQAAFVPEGMVRWLNEIRPPGEAEVTALPWNAETAAEGIDRLFRERAAWWGGEVGS
jgi:hypothetical protein